MTQKGVQRSRLEIGKSIIRTESLFYEAKYGKKEREVLNGGERKKGMKGEQGNLNGRKGSWMNFKVNFRLRGIKVNSVLKLTAL